MKIKFKESEKRIRRARLNVDLAIIGFLFVVFAFVLLIVKLVWVVV